MANIALLNFGSAGDVHPMLALGAGLRASGHRVCVLTNPIFANQVVREGLEFVPVGEADHYCATINHPKLWHPIDGMGVMWRYLLRPALVPSYEALARLHGGEKWLVIASPLAMGARLAQEKLGMAVVTAYTSAAMLRTVEDSMTLARWRVPAVVPKAWREFAWRGLDRFKLEPLVRPALDAMRDKLGLPRLAQSVFGKWMHSPLAGVTLFAPWFAPRAADWPAQVVEAGFPLYDGDAAEPASPGLEAFLARGAAPVVFMHGTASVDGAAFFQAAAAACKAVGCRAVFLGSSGMSAWPDGIHAEPYTSFGRLLPRARALVHHGGIGSCAQALRAGVPQVIVPRAYDQFDNAMRIEQLDVGRSLGYGPAALGRMAQRLREVLDSAAIREACAMHAGPSSRDACHEVVAALVKRFE
ncbi:MAG: glycosyltransferase [Pseudomonadota bacterium]